MTYPANLSQSRFNLNLFYLKNIIKGHNEFKIGINN